MDDRLRTLGGGDTPLGIRLPAILVSLVGPLVLWRTAGILFGPIVARRAVWIALAMPLLAVGGVIITPDTPSVLFWGLAGWALAELYVSRNANWWLAVGLFAGLGLLSKYSNLFVGASILLWLVLLPAPTGRGFAAGSSGPAAPSRASWRCPWCCGTASTIGPPSPSSSAASAAGQHLTLAYLAELIGGASA